MNLSYSLTVITLVAAALIVGCAGKTEATPVPTQPPPTAAPTAASAAPSAGASIYYQGNAQVEIVSSGGTRVLIDVYNPSLLSSPATDQDVLLLTHKHTDHFSAAFVKSFAGQQMIMKTGEIKAGEVTIRGIASAHNAADKLDPEKSTNYIYIIEMDGLRLVHFGDIGQEQLTAEQLEALGSVDVAMMQLVNSYSDMSLANQKGFKLMDQVQPKLIIPTHTDTGALKYAINEKKWGGLYADGKFALVSADKLPASASLLIIGSDAFMATYKKLLNLTDW